MIRAAICFLAACLLSTSLQAAPFEVKKSDDGVEVWQNGKLLTRYVKKSKTKPILWPLHGPHGSEITRAYPMRKAGEGERGDHPHHRSFWFDHGDVNGVSFWHENEGAGSIEHREFLKTTGGDTAVITTRNDWVTPEGKTVCSDVRTLTFGVDEGMNYIDVDVTVTAKGDTVFGDTKEGSFGVRTAGTMKVDSKLGGTITNSEGQTDKGAWGKPASWVDYVGPVKGNTVGIAILNHPSSFRYPTHWHVRTYGLFAANPFGLKDFYGKASGKDGTHKMKDGETFTLRYRVLLHKGDTKSAGIAEAFKRYAQVAK